MNRAKAEEARKYREAREGKSAAEISALDRDEATSARVRDLANALHGEWFPEEYDYMNDSISDAKDRARGISPMSDEYMATVNARRRQRGVGPLPPSGKPSSRESWELAYAEAAARIRAGSGE